MKKVLSKIFCILVMLCFGFVAIGLQMHVKMVLTDHVYAYSEELGKDVCILDDCDVVRDHVHEYDEDDKCVCGEVRPAEPVEEEEEEIPPTTEEEGVVDPTETDTDVDISDETEDEGTEDVDDNTNDDIVLDEGVDNGDDEGIASYADGDENDVDAPDAGAPEIEDEDGSDVVVDNEVTDVDAPSEDEGDVADEIITTDPVEIEDVEDGVVDEVLTPHVVYFDEYILSLVHLDGKVVGVWRIVVEVGAIMMFAIAALVLGLMFKVGSKKNDTPKAPKVKKDKKSKKSADTTTETTTHTPRVRW